VVGEIGSFMPPVVEIARSGSIVESTGTAAANPFHASQTHACGPITTPPAGAVGATAPGIAVGRIAAELRSSACSPAACAIVVLTPLNPVTTKKIVACRMDKCTDGFPS
jgi:hypothetical protein